MKPKLVSLAILALALAGCSQTPNAAPAPAPAPDSYCQSLDHGQCTQELTDKVLEVLDVYEEKTSPTDAELTAYNHISDVSGEWSRECMNNPGLVAGDSECAALARDLTATIQVIDPSMVPVFRQ